MNQQRTEWAGDVGGVRENLEQLREVLFDSYARDEVIRAGILGSRRRPTSRQLQSAVHTFVAEVEEGLAVDGAVAGVNWLRWSEDGTLVHAGWRTPSGFTHAAAGLQTQPDGGEWLLSPTDRERLEEALAGRDQRDLGGGEILELVHRAASARVNLVLWIMVLRGQMHFDARARPYRFVLTDEGRSLARQLGDVA